MTTDRFHAFHCHGFARVGVATPLAAIADPAVNAERAVAEIVAADREGCDLLVFPELNLSAYAIDDLHLQDALLDAVERAVETVREKSADLSPLVLVGAPLRRSGRVYNCAVAISRGRILGVVPKTFLPNYREYYEKRWFASGAGLSGLSIALGGEEVPFGPDLLFEAGDLPGFVTHVEICEDFWGPSPPSTAGALAGALVLANLSASNITVGKAADREILTASQSMRAVAAYIYSAAGPGESSTDLSWDGQGSIHELGDPLAASDRFRRDAQRIFADVDLDRIRQERQRTGTFNDAAALAGHPEQRFRRIRFEHRPHFRALALQRPLRRFPFVPNSAARLAEDCYEAFNIQVHALARRFESTGAEHMVVGVSGGLDSTHALLVAAKVCDLLELPRTRILGFTMPGFATSPETKGNAFALMHALGVTAEEIDIRPAAQQMLVQMRHPFAQGEPVYDIAFENVQAGLRTDFLFRLANQRSGFVLGTGDLSELALGWSTYGVGDQMSHYGVNAGVPKTLIQHLIRWTAAAGEIDRATGEVLQRILATEISPELVPAGEDRRIQSTEDKIGPYELNDFFLFHTLRSGQRPEKIAFLALQAWGDVARGDWPAGMPSERRRAYDLATIRHWLERFVVRFFQLSQFKRSALPNGPKVSAGGALSPRGDWRAPSDGRAEAFLESLERVPRS